MSCRHRDAEHCGRRIIDGTCCCQSRQWGNRFESSERRSFESNRLARMASVIGSVEGLGSGDGDDDGNGGVVVVSVERQRRRAINNDRIPSIVVSNRGR